MHDSSVKAVSDHRLRAAAGKLTPSISVIIPCRNEEKYIGECLDSIIGNDFSKDDLEVLVVDGMSDDGTREVVRKYANNNPFIRLLDNPKKIAPSAMNIGIRESAGDSILILGAHSKIDKKFLRTNIESLEKYGVDCVGGVIKTLPTNNTPLGQAIALALSHPFGVGNSYFRIGAHEPRHVDTVPFGCYRREVFERVGLFDEDLIRNQDDEFNLRLIRNGGKIMLVPEIVSYYYARDSLRKLWGMFFQYGYFKPLVASKVKGVMTLRQIVPALFVLTLAISLATGLLYKPLLWIFLLTAVLYAFVNASVSFKIARGKGIRHFPGLVASFLTLHFSYGLGYLKGLMDFIFARKHIKKKIEDAPITR